LKAIGEFICKSPACVGILAHFNTQVLVDLNVRFHWLKMRSDCHRSLIELLNYGIGFCSVSWMD